MLRSAYSQFTGQILAIQWSNTAHSLFTDLVLVKQWSNTAYSRPLGNQPETAASGLFSDLFLGRGNSLLQSKNKIQSNDSALLRFCAESWSLSLA
jgi:hypothetical protein